VGPGGFGGGRVEEIELAQLLLEERLVRAVALRPDLRHAVAEKLLQREVAAAEAAIRGAPHACSRVQPPLRMKAAISRRRAWADPARRNSPCPASVPVMERLSGRITTAFVAAA
jgi:hypothetical protein